MQGYTSNIYATIEGYTCNCYLRTTLKLTNLDQQRFEFKRIFKLCYVGVLEVHKNKKKVVS